MTNSTSHLATYHLCRTLPVLRIAHSAAIIIIPALSRAALGVFATRLTIGSTVPAEDSWCGTDKHRCCQSSNDNEEGETHWLHEVIWDLFEFE
ncbi:hypothetical protein BDR06DRAFT_953492 [Suillus hirtellus]|nr:hypothetical protein BDR06DRAFT_953492 [Suillus hirtellus]